MTTLENTEVRLHHPGEGFFVSAPASPWMPTPDAAAYCALSRRTLEGYRHRGGGPRYSRPSRQIVLYHRDDLDSWLRGAGAVNTTHERLSGRL